MYRKDSVFESTSYYHRRFPGNRQLHFERCQIESNVAPSRVAWSNLIRKRRNVCAPPARLLPAPVAPRFFPSPHDPAGEER